MRFLFFLLLWASSSWAAFAPGTVSYYKMQNGSLVDATGFDTVGLSITGANVLSVTSPFQGRGTFTAGAIMMPGAAAQAAMSGLTNYTIQMDNFYVNSLPGNQFPFAGQDGGVNYYLNAIGTSGVAYFHWVTEDGGTNNLDTPANSLQIGVTYSVTLTYDGTTKRTYINNILSASVVHAAALPATVATLHFGAQWPPAAVFPCDCYIGGIRLMNKAVVPPIIDPSGQRSPMAYNRQRNKQGPGISPALAH